MGEEEMRGRMDRQDRKIDRIEEKIDSLRKELQANSNEVHAEIHRRITQIELEMATARPVIEAAKKHLDEDTGFEEGWNGKISTLTAVVSSSLVTGVVAIIVSRLFK